jgi:hypothetical protein
MLTARRTVLRATLAFACLLTLPAGPSCVRAAEPTGHVAALRFTSDHKVICRNTIDLLTGGERYPDVAWRAEPAVNAPITHTGGSDVHIEADITLELAGIAADTPYRVEGVSAESALRFRKDGRLSGAAQEVIALEASKALGRPVRKITQKITWLLTLHPGTENARSVRLGQTGPHVVYVTRGRPHNTDEARSVVTDIRMETAVERVAAAEKAAGDKASPPGVLWELMKQNGDHYLPTRHYSKEKAWKVPESWREKPKGASCISIVEFVGLLCKMIGFEGTTATTAYYAKPPNTRQALQGGLGDPPITRKAPNNETWYLYLVDDTNTNYGLAGGVGGMNYYEAVLQYELDGKTYYYPGGTDRVWDNPENVLKVFRTLSWAAWDESVQDWVVREVVDTYIKPGEKRPRSIRLP